MKPLIWPWHQLVRHAKTPGTLHQGLFADYDCYSYTRDILHRSLLTALDHFGLCMVWKCDASGESFIRRTR